MVVIQNNNNERLDQDNKNNSYLNNDTSNNKEVKEINQFNNDSRKEENDFLNISKCPQEFLGTSNNSEKEQENVDGVINCNNSEHTKDDFDEDWNLVEKSSFL